MLAGRKLLLADDSVTIQKVIELTFADEGVRVVAFSNGLDAIEKLEEEAPDIVLADVFMPSKGGYEVCEYVKRNEKLKHIPVMLLVGSFEPFDEAEARRVGADDILTKPFQSIRRLIDRVGALVSSPPIKKEVPTAELPKVEEAPADKETLDTGELELTTADTMPLPEELRETLEMPQPVSEDKNTSGGKKMETETVAVNEDTQQESSDVLLDLGEFEPTRAASGDDFILDLDMPEVESTYAETTLAPMRAFVEPQIAETVPTGIAAPAFSYQPEVQAPSYSEAEEIAYEDQVHEIVSDPQPIYEVPSAPTMFEPEPVAVEPEPVIPSSISQSSLVVPGELSQEMIDAIARRAVEMMSEKVIREIAWEVVPDLAELLIKRHLEEKESQPK